MKGEKLTCGDMTEANPEFGCHPTRSKARMTDLLCIHKILVPVSRWIAKCSGDHWHMNLLPHWLHRLHTVYVFKCASLRKAGANGIS
jgi:hypothetical protein